MITARKEETPSVTRIVLPVLFRSERSSAQSPLILVHPPPVVTPNDPGVGCKPRAWLRMRSYGVSASSSGFSVRKSCRFPLLRTHIRTNWGSGRSAAMHRESRNSATRRRCSSDGSRRIHIERTVKDEEHRLLLSLETSSVSLSMVS